MPALHHVYLTAHGIWTNASFDGETAQIGLRLPIIDNTAVPAKGAIFTPVANGDVVATGGSTAGTNGTLAETWTARLGAVGSTDNADGAWQADLADDFWTFLNTIKSRIGDQFSWTHVKIAPILADGSYAAPSAIYSFTTALKGTGTAQHLPPEVAVAVSLRANIIGRRGRGRMYIPGITAAELGADEGTVVAAARTAFAGALATLVGNLGNPPGTPDYSPMVAVGSAGSATFVRPAEVRVGDHFDVQRRRQHQVPETYTIQAL